MLKIIIILSLFANIVLSKSVETKNWKNGQSFLTFLNSNKIPIDLYFNLSKTDKELCTEIQANVRYHVVRNDNNTLKHALIPITEEMQIHIHENNNSYKLEFIPIVFELKKEILVIETSHSPYLDIVNVTNNRKLAHAFVKSFKKSFNFRRLQKKDKIIIQYEQKIRMGKYYGTPNITAAYIKGKYNKKYIFQNPNDDRYYDEKGKSLTSVFFRVPLSYSRISSKFTYKRFHPIKKIYRPHLGIDYAAPTGRKIWATADGKIVYRGRKGGHGNVIESLHPGGYRSLYAHMSKFSTKYKRGSRVKQGSVIGYVGTTGSSTGPHLHFGMYKNGRAINPGRVISYSKKTLSGPKRKEFLNQTNFVKNLFE
jgi:murein DD-endopeptidase MepM/ murein hydrolase activator NlpD